jgi:hypothetical protein
MQPLIGDIGFTKDRFHRTFRDTAFAIDALHGIDVEHVVVLVKTFRGTDNDAVGVLAVQTRFANDIGHGFAPLTGWKNYWTPLFLGNVRAGSRDNSANCLKYPPLL